MIEITDLRQTLYRFSRFDTFIVTVVAPSEGVTASRRLTTAREVLQSGDIVKALQQILPDTEAVELPARFSSAQKEFDMGKIDYKEFEKVQNRIITAARKLM